MSCGVGVGFGIPIRPVSAPALQPEASIDAAKSERSAIFICEPFRGSCPPTNMVASNHPRFYPGNHATIAPRLVRDGAQSPKFRSRARDRPPPADAEIDGPETDYGVVR